VLIVTLLVRDGGRGHFLVHVVLHSSFLVRVLLIRPVHVPVVASHHLVFTTLSIELVRRGSIAVVVVRLLGLLLELRRHHFVVAVLVVWLLLLLMMVLIIFIGCHWSRLLLVVALMMIDRVVVRLGDTLSAAVVIMVHDLFARVVLSVGTLLAVIVIILTIVFLNGRRVGVLFLFPLFVRIVVTARLLVLVNLSEGGGGRGVAGLPVERLLQSVRVRRVLILAG